MHKAFPFENVSWIDFPFLTNSRHTKAYKIGIGSEEKLSTWHACIVGFTIEKQRWLKRIRKNRTRKKMLLKQETLLNHVLIVFQNSIENALWDCLTVPLKCYNATLVYSLNDRNELEACIIYLRVSMSRNCCHRNESIYLYREWLWNCIEPES